MCKIAAESQGGSEEMELRTRRREGKEEGMGEGGGGRKGLKKQVVRCFSLATYFSLHLL